MSCAHAACAAFGGLVPVVQVQLVVCGAPRLIEIELLVQVCTSCAAQVALAELMPDESWAQLAAVLHHVTGGVVADRSLAQLSFRPRSAPSGAALN